MSTILRATVIAVGIAGVTFISLVMVERLWLDKQSTARMSLVPVSSVITSTVAVCPGPGNTWTPCPWSDALRHEPVWPAK